MVKRARIYYNNAVYHICIRGNNKQYILKDVSNKLLLLDSLEKFRRRFGFKIYCFVIMDNHVHLVIKTASQVSISKIMQAINLSFSVRFRKKSGYTGYVWQGRFRSNVIEGEKYILECINYIHNNPLRANVVDKITDYSWSSYHFYHGLDTEVTSYIQIDKFS